MYRSLAPVSKVAVNRVSVRYASSEGYVNAIAALKQDLKKAMIAKDNLKKTTIRGLLSNIKNLEIDNKNSDLNEFTLSDLYTKSISQRKDSIAEFIRNNREDLVEKEANEIKIIDAYLAALPVASKDEVDARVLELLTELKTSNPSLQLKQVFGKLDWKTLPTELKASPAVIRTSVASQFKKVFD